MPESPKTTAASSDPKPKSESTEKSTAKASDDAKSSEETPVFSHEDLIRRAYRTVGHSPTVIGGALAGVQKKNLTIEEAREACEKFLRHKDSTIKDIKDNKAEPETGDDS